jgi:NAD(P)H-hydrate epimerase
MIPLYSTKQIRDIDEYAIKKVGIPGLVLMENASREIFEKVYERIEHLNSPKIGFVCSKGNNGGDGFAAARHFYNAGYDIVIVYLGNEKEMSEDCKFNFSTLKKLSLKDKRVQFKKYTSSSSLNVLKGCDIIFDAMLGSGIQGKLKEPYPTIINYLNKLIRKG